MNDRLLWNEYVEYIGVKATKTIYVLVLLKRVDRPP